MGPIVTYVVCHQGRDGSFRVTLHRKIDSGSDTFFDVYAFQSADGDDPPTVSFGDAISAMDHAVRGFNADADRFVNAGVIQDEYADYRKGSAPSAPRGGDMSSERSSEWTIARAASESLGEWATWRFRKTIAAEDKSRLRTSVSIVWGFVAPSQELQRTMEEFEDYLAPLSDDADSVLAVVVTHSTAREWVFYVSSYPDFEKHLNRALQARPSYPVELTWLDDSAWQVYEQLVSHLLTADGAIP